MNLEKLAELTRERESAMAEKRRKGSEIDYKSFPCKPADATKIKKVLERLGIFTYQELIDVFDLGGSREGVELDSYRGFGEGYVGIVKQHLATVKYLSQVSKLILESHCQK